MNDASADAFEPGHASDCIRAARGRNCDCAYENWLEVERLREMVRAAHRPIFSMTHVGHPELDGSNRRFTWAGSHCAAGDHSNGYDEFLPLLPTTNERKGFDARAAEALAAGHAAHVDALIGGTP